MFNLQDPKNPELKKRILDQELTSEQVFSGDSKILASSALRKAREQTFERSVLGARSDYESMRVIETF